MTAASSTPDVEALVARARQHGLGNVLRRTALRLPDKTGLVDGDVRITDALPKNPSGKILKRQLRDEYADLSGSA